MLYDRKIRYLDYLENGQRIQGAGYVKVECREGTLRLELAITGLRATDSCEKDVLICSQREEKSIGKVIISNGRGQYGQLYHDLRDIGGTGIPYEELQGIRIPMGVGREISSSWQSRQIQRGSEEIRASSISEGAAEQNQIEMRRQTEEPRAGKAAPGEKEMPAQISEKDQRAGRTEQKRENLRSREDDPMLSEEHQTGNGGQEQRAAQRREGAASGVRQLGGWNQTDKPGREVQGRESVGMQEKPMRLLEDKWQQLWAIYPHIKPFQDEREYLSIGPADFVLFSSDSYRMVNNSFLLHGYYNYRHLLLARLERKGEAVYYVGVPGSYFEKEKQVAIMFGFESFECAEEPAQPGDFGYYMMRAQI